MAKLIHWLERLVLGLIILMTLGAIGFELARVLEQKDITLADILLLFLYAEVLSMVAAYFKRDEIFFIFPIFIGITALARLIILQGKDMAPENILYEAISIMILAVAVVLLRAPVMGRLERYLGAAETGDGRHRDDDGARR